jgi:hypothetical protein
MNEYNSLEDSLADSFDSLPLVDIDDQFNDLRLTSEFDDEGLLHRINTSESPGSVFLGNVQRDVEPEKEGEVLGATTRGKEEDDVDDDPIKVLLAAIEADRPK